MLSIDKRISISDFALANSPDILCLNETWLHDDIDSDSIFTTNQYMVISRRDRISGVHGGVMICAKSELSHLLYDIPVDDYDFVSSAAVVFTNFALLICTVYLPPIGSPYFIEADTLRLALSLVHSRFLTLISQKGVSNHNLYVCGDLNLPQANWMSMSSIRVPEQKVLDVFCEFSLNQFVVVPTHEK